jgi:hypothetical protein
VEELKAKSVTREELDDLKRIFGRNFMLRFSGTSNRRAVFTRQLPHLRRVPAQRRRHLVLWGNPGLLLTMLGSEPATLVLGLLQLRRAGPPPPELGARSFLKKSSRVDGLSTAGPNSAIKRRGN